MSYLCKAVMCPSDVEDNISVVYRKVGKVQTTKNITLIILIFEECGLT